MKRLRVCVVAALRSFASFVVAPPVPGSVSRPDPSSSTTAEEAPLSRPAVAFALALFALAPAAIPSAAAQTKPETDGSGGGPFVWSRGAFRFLSACFVVSDINERGTAVGRDTEHGWAV